MRTRSDDIADSSSQDWLPIRRRRPFRDDCEFPTSDWSTARSKAIVLKGKSLKFFNMVRAAGLSRDHDSQRPPNSWRLLLERLLSPG